MKEINNYINKHVLVKVGNLNTVSGITKIIGGLLTSKMIAVFIGVEGMALIGNFRNFMNAVRSFAILGLYKAFVKAIAEVKNDVVKLGQTLSTSFYVGFMATIITAVLCYYNAEFINNFLFTPEYDFAYAIKIMAVAVPLYSVNMYSFAIMNGFLKYKILLIINIIGQVLGLLVAVILIYQHNIDGALMAAVITPALVLLITIVGFMNQRSMIAALKLSNIKLGVLKNFPPYAIIALLSSTAIPVVAILIRNHIIGEIGATEAGYWEAMRRISDYYLMFINSIMALYFLPRFREIETNEEFRKEIFDFCKGTLSFFGIGLVIIYLLRSFLVTLIFSESFAPAQDLFFWQMLGDIVKVLSLVIVYRLIAKKMFVHFIIVQVFLVVIMYLSSVYFIDIYGVKGAVIGHFISYLMYFGIVLLLFGSSLFKVIPEDIEV